ncbi:thioredoxin family protein [Bacillus thermotolerans]|uniref:Thioredoxin n=1 Tax=Bacillus thermotolerans TaxID=1221996 RepID=A0A0F5HW97_BACTR|nr:thioredoxin family protein [Bacillus thermotolerans]KKB36018.1 Thioredoxin [Bacillus thermotolerans]KKB37117.1 Thioredoxin [Bacillus thermotolerans]KKB40280.1 Thioredoxin [Bacillus thermotolerans]
MQTVLSLSKLQEIINDHEAVLVFVSAPNCSVCTAMQPRVEELLKQFPSVKSVYVNTGSAPEISGQYTVFSVPAILFFIHGKEAFRKARFIRLDELEHEVSQVLKLI